MGSETDKEQRTAAWRELLAETTSLIGEEQHARWICETAASASAAEFSTMLDEPATERMVEHLDAMVARARLGEPIQYVLGSWGFRHVDLAIDNRVLIPRPETEEVAGVAIELASRAGPVRHVVDLGTGSGAIGLSLAYELPADGTNVLITDHSSRALEVARSNIAGIGHNGSNVRVAEGDWVDAVPTVPMVDVIVSNPPYVADGSTDVESSVSEWEPASALFSGVDGLDAIRVIVPSAAGRLRPGGWLLLEHGYDQGDAVRELFARSGYEHVETRRDLTGLDRMTLGRRPLDLFEAASDHGRVVVRHLQNRIEDYACLLSWLTTPDVLEWYEGRDEVFDLARILREYGPGSETESDGIIPAIIELDGLPVGYVQLYELDDPEDAAEFDLDSSSTGDPAGGVGMWSIDLFIGEPDLFGHGIGRAVCRGAAEFMLDAFGARDVVILPYLENARAIAAYQAAGFHGDHVVVEHEMHEGRMRDGIRLHFER